MWNTIQELREQFERMAVSSHFDIVRMDNGEYRTSGRNTFMLWAGFWECAKINGVIDPESSALEMNRF